MSKKFKKGKIKVNSNSRDEFDRKSKLNNKDEFSDNEIGNNEINKNKVGDNEVLEKKNY